MVRVEQEHVVLGLAAGILHHHVPALGGIAPAEPLGLAEVQLRLAWDRVLLAGQARLLGFQDEAAAAVEVDPLRGRGVGAAAGPDRTLEHVVVLGAVTTRDVRPRHADDVAELAQEYLVVGTLGTPDAARPAGDEVLDVQTSPLEVGHFPARLTDLYAKVKHSRRPRRVGSGRCPSATADVGRVRWGRAESMVPFGLSAYALAKACAVPRTRIERVAAEQIGISGDTAVRLGRVFDTTPEFWMNLQQRYDLERTAHALGSAIDGLRPLHRAA